MGALSAYFHMARAAIRTYIGGMDKPQTEKTAAAKRSAGPKSAEIPESIREDRAVGAREAAKKNLETRKTVEEIGGADAPEPTRHGDWEFGGRCSDF